jgi:hypothetical protein
MKSKFATIVISRPEYVILNNFLVKGGMDCMKINRDSKCSAGGVEKCDDFIIATLMIKKFKIAFGDDCDPLPEHWQKLVDEISNKISCGSFVGGEIKNCN